MNDGTQVNIEVQVCKDPDMARRSLYYWAKMYGSELREGESYDKLMPAISINLMDFNAFAQYTACHHSYHICNDETKDILIDDLEMHFIELEKIRIGDIRKLRKSERWIAYFSHQCSDEEREVLAMSEPAIKEAMKCEMYFTQDEKLRKRFKGKPEYIVNFMRFVAQDLREIMARLGFHTIDEMVGRYDCLKQKQHVPNWKAATVNLKNLLFRPYTDASVGHHCTMDQDHGINATLDMSKLIRMCRPALEQKKHICARLRIQNTDRVTGALLGSEITRRYGEKGLPEDTISLSFVGSAGQSFGAFIPKGLTLSLEGDANDYVGKGLSGGKIIVSPPRGSVFPAEDNIIIGNVAFYGATSGEAYINGTAGERFCVRNSGATAVVEGVGNHGCEYMTGGRVLILGSTGRNFAAGMSGGIAYVYDLEPAKCNPDLVKLEDLTDPDEQQFVKSLLEKHVAYTDSNLGHMLLENWEDTVSRITKVIPEAYEEMVSLIAQAQAEGHSEEEAHMIAFEQKHGKKK